MPWTHQQTLTRHGSNADDQGGHYSVQCDGGSKNGHTAGDVVHHLILRGATQGKLGESAGLGQVNEEQEEWESLTGRWYNRY